jgi:hypothetical protein
MYLVYVKYARAVQALSRPRPSGSVQAADVLSDSMAGLPL